jgi:hypothetical protein
MRKKNREYTNAYLRFIEGSKKYLQEFVPRLLETRGMGHKIQKRLLSYRHNSYSYTGAWAGSGFPIENQLRRIAVAKCRTVAN